MYEELFGKTGLSLDRLQTLCEIAEWGSIGEATRDNSNRQTQFSRQVGELEKYFGVDLLDRHSRPYRLSEEGEELSKISRELLGRLSDFKSRCNDRPVRLVIGAGESTIQWLLMPLLDELSQRLPNASISMENLRTLEIVKGLNEGDIDFGMIRKTAVAKPLKSTGSWKYGYSLFVPKALKKRLQEKVEVTDLSSLPLAIIGGKGEFRRQLDKLAIEGKGRLNIRLECSSHAQVATAILSGKHAGFLPDFAQRILPATRVNSHEVKGFEGLSRELVIAWHPKHKDVRPVVAEVLDLLKV
ncbi:MAG: LysR family transcriptional regulator [Verrucomicrobiota bacterium]